MIILVFEYEVLKHRIVKSWKLRQRLDELQAILPLAIEDELRIVKMMKGNIFLRRWSDKIWMMITCLRKTMSSERSPLMTPLSRSRLTCKRW